MILMPPSTKEIKKGSGFGRFEVVLQLNEQLRATATATAAK